jgi:oligoribonuclease NrnB/cAMP/cGMP phosphodiesterase (DHH superfamily)
MKTKIIYHRGDLDGLASAAVLRYKYKDAALIGAEYSDDPDQFIAQVSKDDHVIVVDFTLEPFSKMLELKEKCGHLTWIDHHVSAINAWNENGRPFDAYVGDDKNKKAACELAWEWTEPKLQCPQTIRLLSLYDTWQLTDEVKEFQFGARFFLESLESPNWKKILSGHYTDIREIRDTGQKLLEWEQKNNTRRVREHMFRMDFMGYRACVLNTIEKGSQIFDSVDPASYDIMIVFGLVAANKFRYSIYTERPDIDVSKIALKLGGGGHRKASGWISDKLPWGLTS